MAPQAQQAQPHLAQGPAHPKLPQPSQMQGQYGHGMGQPNLQKPMPGTDVSVNRTKLKSSKFSRVIINHIIALNYLQMALCLYISVKIDFRVPMRSDLNFYELLMETARK